MDLRLSLATSRRREVAACLMAAESQRILLDLSRYADREQALVPAAHGCPTAYTEIAKKHMMGNADLTMTGTISMPTGRAADRAI